MIMIVAENLGFPDISTMKFVMPLKPHNNARFVSFSILVVYCSDSRIMPALSAGP